MRAGERGQGNDQADFWVVICWPTEVGSERGFVRTTNLGPV